MRGGRDWEESGMATSTPPRLVLSGSVYSATRQGFSSNPAKGTTVVPTVWCIYKKLRKADRSKARLHKTRKSAQAPLKNPHRFNSKMAK